MPAPDPWRLSLVLLDRDEPRFVIGGPAYSTRWEPMLSRNPRRRDGAGFAGTLPAVTFVVERLRRIVRRTHDPRVRWRTERFRQEIGRIALVLEVGGPHGHPTLYAKWLVDPECGEHGRVCFISFHPSERPWRRAT
jgi:hypothetical protein